MLVLIGVVLAGAVYARGVHIVWRRAGYGVSVHTWQAACFAAALLTILAALESPLDAASHALFSAHMVQHLLLILVAGPLLVLGAPLLPFLWALPAVMRPRVGGWSKWARTAWATPVAFALHSLALWAWHVPMLYQAAVLDPLVHVVEHASFLGTAILFWFAVLHGGQSSYAAGVLYVFGLALQSTVLGALLTFAQAPWYSSHLASTAAWSLSPLEDQQLAGLIMWIPGGLVYLASALALFSTLFGRMAPRSQ